MGSKKSSILEKIKEGERVGSEALDVGKKLEGDGHEIKALIDSIDTSMDEDDAQAIKTAESGYSRDFDVAVKSEIDPKEAQMEQLETNATQSSELEKGKVEKAKDTLTEMVGISEVGRTNAEGASDRMSVSAQEYSDYIDEANSIIEQTGDDISSVRDAIGSIFGA